MRDQRIWPLDNGKLFFARRRAKAKTQCSKPVKGYETVGLASVLGWNRRLYWEFGAAFNDPLQTIAGRRCTLGSSQDKPIIAYIDFMLSSTSGHMNFPRIPVNIRAIRMNMP